MFYFKCSLKAINGCLSWTRSKGKISEDKTFPNGIILSLKYWILESNPTEFAFCQMSQRVASPTVRKKVHNDESKLTRK